MLRVTLTECYGARVARVSRHRSGADAVARAVRRAYGRRAVWVGDTGLPGFGQVGLPLPGRCVTLITGRVRVDVDADTGVVR